MLDSFVPRSVCARCERPEKTCVCAHIVPVETRTRVLIVQHPREARTAIGTARLAHLGLPSSELVVGVHVDDHPRVRALTTDPAFPPLLLYPSADATPLERFAGTARTLVVIDGTWPQSKTLLRDNPGLASLPRAAFTPRAPSDYRIRREPKAAFVSTVESIVHALGILEDDAAPERLLAPFRAMVDAQIRHEDENPSPRRKRPRKGPPRRERLFPALVDAASRGDLVCVVAEANAWPYTARKRGTHHPDEPVQLLAIRIATGETLDVVLRPESPLAPSTLSHTGLDAATLEGGLDRAVASERARAFFAPTDVLATWGHYATNLAAAAGLLPDVPIECLRGATKRFVNGKVGTVEEHLATRGIAAPPSLGRGRGGRRLASLVAAWSWLRTAERGNLLPDEGSSSLVAPYRETPT